MHVKQVFKIIGKSIKASKQSPAVAEFSEKYNNESRSIYTAPSHERSRSEGTC